MLTKEQTNHPIHVMSRNENYLKHKINRKENTPKDGLHANPLSPLN